MVGYFSKVKFHNAVIIVLLIRYFKILYVTASRAI